MSPCLSINGGFMLRLCFSASDRAVASAFVLLLLLLVLLFPLCLLGWLLLTPDEDDERVCFLSLRRAGW